MVDSKVRLPKANGDFPVPSGTNLLTLGLKSRISDAADSPIIGKSVEYLSCPYELTVNISPTFPLATWYWSNIINNLFEGTAEPWFLTIAE